MRPTGTTIVVATQNKGKVREFSHAFDKLGITVRSMFDYPELPEIIEDGATFAENARIKAKVVGDALQLPVLADDSGLSVDALEGAPGIYSARYAGIGAQDEDNNAKLLRELAAHGSELELDEPVHGQPPEHVKLLSAARFRCALALYDPAAAVFYESEGQVEGWILDHPAGAGGFGYDPLFWLPSYGRTMAEISKDEKQLISHRGQALSSLISMLER